MGVGVGTIEITATSNSGGALQYSIDGGTTWDGSGVFAGLDAANNPYEIRIRNADGTCVVTSTDISLTNKVQPAYTAAPAFTNPTNCNTNDGTITITATGTAIEYSIDGGLNYQASNSFTGLTAGTYNVYVRNGDESCSTPYNLNPIILTIPDAPAFTNVAFTDPTDCGVTDGTINIAATGGSGAYQYSINGGGDWTNTTGSFPGLSAGTYDIMIRNDDGTCEVTGPIVVLTDKVAPVIANVASTNPTECSVADGQLLLQQQELEQLNTQLMVVQLGMVLVHLLD